MVLAYILAQLVLWAQSRPGGLLVVGSANVDERYVRFLLIHIISSVCIGVVRFCTLSIECYLMYTEGV